MPPSLEPSIGSARRKRAIFDLKMILCGATVAGRPWVRSTCRPLRAFENSIILLQRKPKPVLRVFMSIFSDVIDSTRAIIKGTGVTLSYIPKQKWTVQYPEEPVTLQP